MRQRGRRPKVLVTYVGYVAQTAAGPVARVRARVLRRAVLPAAGPVRGWRTFMETVAWFASAEVPGVPVEVSSDRETVRVVSDKEGYVEARVPVGPPTERQVEVRMTTPGAPDTPAVAVAVTDHDRPLVVSDIDDTVLITGVKERLAMIRRTLFGDPTDRQTVPGMADLVRQLAVGDSGQHDVDAYLQIARAHPGRVRAVLIREVPGLRRAGRDHGPAHARAEEFGVPLCIGAPEELTDAARRCGVLA